MSIDNDNIEICDECGFSLIACRCDDLGDPDYEEDEEDTFDCGMGRDGLCGKAGSEECDFLCPYRDAKRN
jgi:hypothetical protein